MLSRYLFIPLLSKPISMYELRSSSVGLGAEHVLSRLEGSTWDSFVSCCPITFPKARSWDGKFGESHWAWGETGDWGPDQLAWDHTMGYE